MASYFHYMTLARQNRYYTTLTFRLRAILLLIALCFFATSYGAIFTIKNNCPFTVWAAAVPGGGWQLKQGEIWEILVPSGTKQGRIWARTNCQFDASGKGRCQTGDCKGLFHCRAYGTPPNTMAEYAFGQFPDFIDISNVDGFNVPMELSSSSPGCNLLIKCMGDVVGYCPNELRAPGGCNGPCTVFKTNEYCCNSSDCGPTNYSKYFKGRCPDAYSYPKDDPTSLFTCPTGSDYNVTFCPCVFRQQLCAVE